MNFQERVLSRTGLELGEIPEGDPEDVIGGHIFCSGEDMLVVAIGYPDGDEDGADWWAPEPENFRKISWVRAPFPEDLHNGGRLRPPGIGHWPGDEETDGDVERHLRVNHMTGRYGIEDCRAYMEMLVDRGLLRPEALNMSHWYQVNI